MRGHRDFFRESSTLAIVLISDEDEYEGHENYQVHQLLQLVHNTWGSDKNLIFNSIVVKEGDIECIESTGGSEGLRYAELSRVTGGVVASICDADYSHHLSDIGESVKGRVTSIELECDPIDQDGDGLADIVLRLENEGDSIPQFALRREKTNFCRSSSHGETQS